MQVVRVGKNDLLRVRIPRAARRQRPIFVGENPLRGTYERRNEGDYLLPEERVRQLLGEQSETPRDATMLPRYDIDDLNLETIAAYRQIFASRAPSHPFISQSLPEFLRSVQAWKKDRESGGEGLTVAGLLMFGKLNSILDAVPNYIVDYQERPDARTEARWVDRITTDGSWSGNLFDFYRKVLGKLTADLKIPFVLDGMVRKNVTPVHEAIQEALVNAIVHSDFSGRVSVLVVKRPDMYGFRNPGLMRVPIEQAIRGGDSDCRNRLIQKMFQLVGAGDQAGSGVPRIFGVWKEQSWRSPVVHEKREPEQTLFELRMASLLPSDVVAELETAHGTQFTGLSALEKLIVVTAAVEGYVDHKRVREITDEHPADITKTLSKLSRERLLVPSGHGRGTIYFERHYVQRMPSSDLAEFLRIDPPVKEHAVPSTNPSEPISGATQPSSGGFAENSGGLSVNSGGLEPHPAENPDPIAMATEIVAREFPGGLPGKLRTESMQKLISVLCATEALTLKELATVLGRDSDFLRKHYIRPMVDRGQLVPQFPDRANHPQQKYRTGA